MTRRTVILGIALIAFASRGSAYEQALHQRMSKKALAVATAQNDFYRRLGMTGSEISDADSWIQHGAYHEDDTVALTTTAVRTRNHFFDPVDLKGLTIPNRSVPFGCSIQFLRADDWAIDPAFGNEFNLQNARDHLVGAMFGRNPGTRAVHRNAMFDALGHLVHLVEDMAQPEHTRNDQHLIGSQLVIGSGEPAASIWEGWSAANLTYGPEAFFENYPVVKLSDYRKYFRGAGAGMADYSNRNFFTQDTNESDERPQPPLTSPACYLFASPVVNRATRNTITVREQYFIGPFPASSDVDETFYTGIVDDQYTGAQDSDGAQTVESLLDLETRQYGVDTYSLNDASYLTRATLLMPRAVGYAAGLIDRFFRGRIKADWTDEGSGRYRMVLTNLSNEAIGTNAHVEVLYKNGPTASNPSSDLNVALSDAPLASLVPGFSGIAPGASVSVGDITPLGLADNHSLLEYDRHIVVTGALGSEVNAVVPLVQPGGTGLRVVMKWTDAANGQPPSFVIRENNNFSHLGVFYNFNQFRDEIPNATLTVVSRNEAYFQFDPIAPGGYFMIALLQGTEAECNATSDVTVEWWAFGQLASTSQATVTPCILQSVGSYP